MIIQELTIVEIPAANDEPERQANSPGRRSFLRILFTAGAGALGAILAAPFVRYISYPLFGAATAEQWTDLGPLDEYAKTGEPVRKLVNIGRLDGWQETASQQTVYVTHDAGGSLAVLSSVCPHLGCSVAWHAESTKFVCPCHGGCFAANGTRLSGPPPRGMSTLATKTEGGHLLVSLQTGSRQGSNA
jgi:menaquinol-cytochrome c reductase iron-sulfur subunit